MNPCSMCAVPVIFEIYTFLIFWVKFFDLGSRCASEGAFGDMIEITSKDHSNNGNGVQWVLLVMFVILAIAIVSAALLVSTGS